MRRIGLVAFLVLILLCSVCASDKADAYVQVVVAIQPGPTLWKPWGRPGAGDGDDSTRGQPRHL